MLRSGSTGCPTTDPGLTPVGRPYGFCGLVCCCWLAGATTIPGRVAEPTAAAPDVDDEVLVGVGVTTGCPV